MAKDGNLHAAKSDSTQMGSTVVRVADIAQYISWICNLNEKLCDNEEAYLNKNKLLFRGQANKEYLLLPNIGRKYNGKYAVKLSLLDEEKNLIEEAKYTLPKLFLNNLSPIDLLALMQHYGIPTRLLDVSENALVALYFACESEPEKDGEVIVFLTEEYDIANYPILQAIADSGYFVGTSNLPLEYFYKKIIKQRYFSEQKSRYPQTDKSPDDGALWIERVCNNILFVRASGLVERQHTQFGQYILFPNKIESVTGYKVFTSEIEMIQKDHKNIVKRFIIPREHKESILQNLSLLGFNRETLFRDSIDEVCKGIKNTVLQERLINHNNAKGYQYRNTLLSSDKV